MIFTQKIGFSPEAVLEYYMGCEDKFITPKSYIGILKITLPHIFAFGLFGMVLLHFLVFTSQKERLKTKVLIYLTFTTAILEIVTPFLIISGFESFAYLKLLSFILFELLIVYILWLLFFSIVYE